MEWSGLDLKNGWWTIPASRSKNGLAHRVPLSDTTLEILRGRKKRDSEDDSPPSAFVFKMRFLTKGDTAMTEIQKAVHRLRKVTGIEFVFHDLRRTAASYMTAIGISRLVVSKILNHVERGITAVYDRHSYDVDKSEALTRWAERLGQIFAGGNDAVKAVTDAARSEAAHV